MNTSTPIQGAGAEPVIKPAGQRLRCDALNRFSDGRPRETAIPGRWSRGQQFDLPAVVSEHYTALYRFALALAKNESDAADFTQEAFLILAKHHQKIRRPESIKCWLFTTLHREFLRKARAQRIHPEVQFQVAEHERAAIEPNEHHSFDGQVALAALNRVEEKYRLALELFYLGDLSYKEISAFLGIPMGTVMSRISRGKAQLRRTLSSNTLSN